MKQTEAPHGLRGQQQPASLPDPPLLCPHPSSEQTNSGITIAKYPSPILRPLSPELQSQLPLRRAHRLRKQEASRAAITIFLPRPLLSLAFISTIQPREFVLGPPSPLSLLIRCQALLTAYLTWKIPPSTFPKMDLSIPGLDHCKGSEQGSGPLVCVWTSPEPSSKNDLSFFRNNHISCRLHGGHQIPLPWHPQIATI